MHFGMKEKFQVKFLSCLLCKIKEEINKFSLENIASIPIVMDRKVTKGQITTIKFKLPKGTRERERNIKDL